VLTFTVIAGFSMLGVALSHDDTLVMTADEYRDWRDNMRAANPIEVIDD